MSLSSSFLWCRCSQKSPLSIFPVDNLPDLFHVVQSNVFIVDVVSMLPNINS